ncbi:MAG: hypothetical protein ABIO36_01650 [Pyrinomonadaceae bacterium]
MIIEVWEKLDCENVGATEIKAIETVVVDQYGSAALDSPMVIARQLADEGADLRHSEIMDLYLERESDRPYDAALRNILNIDDLPRTLASLKNLENLRLKYKNETDKDGLRMVRETAVRGKNRAIEISEKRNTDLVMQHLNIEIAQWITIWLQTPEVFEQWVALRQNAPDFIDKFEHIRET